MKKQIWVPKKQVAKANSIALEKAQLSQQVHSFLEELLVSGSSSNRIHEGLLLLLKARSRQVFVDLAFREKVKKIVEKSTVSNLQSDEKLELTAGALSNLGAARVCLALIEYEKLFSGGEPKSSRKYYENCIVHLDAAIRENDRLDAIVFRANMFWAGQGRESRQTEFRGSH